MDARKPPWFALGIAARWAWNAAVNCVPPGRFQTQRLGAFHMPFDPGQRHFPRSDRSCRLVSAPYRQGL